jgi:ATP phosphoribosyltransferase regulatory subunit
MSEFLLPSGLYDLLPPEASRQTYILGTLLTQFELMGYEQAIPPLLEFEDSLLAGKGAALSGRTFRVADPLSQKMLGLRPDITTQMARIAGSRLINAPLPLRLSYTGSVLRTRPNGLDNHRQLSQAGIEYIGAEEPVVETVLTALEGLCALGLSHVVVDFSVAGLLVSILEDAGITDIATIDAIREQVRSKDISHLPDNLPCKALLQKLTSLVGSAEHVLPKIHALTLPASSRRLVDMLQHVIAQLVANNTRATLTIDALDSRGFDYHHGVCFAFYLPVIQQEIGRGGFYSFTREDGVVLPAAGATLYVTRLRAAPITGWKRPLRVYIPADLSITQSQSVRAQGHATIHGKATGQHAIEDAKRLGLDAIYINHQIQKIS